jgi:hypothetical protein
MFRFFRNIISENRGFGGVMRFKPLLSLPAFILISNLVLAFQIKSAQDLAVKVQRGIKTGVIAYTMSEPKEIVSFLGPPEQESQTKTGGCCCLNINIRMLA